MVNIAKDPLRIPEQGELVDVRHRQWLVSDVEPFHPEGDRYREQHAVTLESIEEDANGEQITVIWQIEPGARILEKAGLPEIKGHDENGRLDAFLNAVRWGIATNVDRNNLLSPFRSGITIEDYQLDPLVRAIDMARVNLLIADDNVRYTISEPTRIEILKRLAALNRQRWGRGRSGRASQDGEEVRSSEQ